MPGLADGDAYVVVNVPPYRYVYPPRDFGSLLFFNLNSKPKRFAGEF